MRKAIPNTLCSNFVTFLKWQNYMENKLVVARGQGKSGDRKEVGVAIKGQHEGSSWWWEMSVSWFYQCQYPSSDAGLYHVNIIVLHHTCIPTIISKWKVQLKKLTSRNLKLLTNTIIYCLNSQIPTPFFSKLLRLLCQMSTFTNITLVIENNLCTVVSHITNHWDLGMPFCRISPRWMWTGSVGRA